MGFAGIWWRGRLGLCRFSLRDWLGGGGGGGVSSSGRALCVPRACPAARFRIGFLIIPQPGAAFFLS
jgi:hypothetical protein